MKTIKIFFIIFILITLTTTYSCQDKKNNIIIGRWQLEKLNINDDDELSEDEQFGLGLIALCIGMTGDTLKGDIIEFFKDKTFESIPKQEGKIFQKGNYKLTKGNKYLILNFDIGEKEKYEITKINNNELQLKYYNEPLYIDYIKVH